MENDVVEFLEMLGRELDDFDISSYRINGQGLNENGRGCRVLHRQSGNVVVCQAKPTYPQNRNDALVQMCHLLDVTVSGRESNTPILELLASYENEMCDFEDGKQLAKNVLSIIPNLADSHFRAMTYALARIVAGDPYRRPKRLKEPVGNVEATYDVCKRYRQLILGHLASAFDADVTLNFKIRRTTNKSGSQSRIYGTMDVVHRRGRSIGFAVVGQKMAELIQELGELSFTPYVYTTSGGSSPGREYGTFRVVCEGEDDFEMWTRHRV